VLINIFEVCGRHPEYGTVFTETVMTIYKDGVVD